jgi:hypothetical protein
VKKVSTLEQEIEKTNAKYVALFDLNAVMDSNRFCDQVREFVHDPSLDVVSANLYQRE